MLNAKTFPIGSDYYQATIHLTPTVYLIGSLRQSTVREVAAKLRKGGKFDVFDDWHAAGPEADDIWQKYEQERGKTYREALEGWHAGNVFDFDFRHINRADIGVLVLPAGKSGHLELGYMLGQGKPGFILMPEEPERWDVMYKFATLVCYTVDELLKCLNAGVKT